MAATASVRTPVRPSKNPFNNPVCAPVTTRTFSLYLVSLGLSFAATAAIRLCASGVAAHPRRCDLHPLRVRAVIPLLPCPDEESST